MTARICRGCPHPPHLGTCTHRSGGTAYACSCSQQTITLTADNITDVMIMRFRDRESPSLPTLRVIAEALAPEKPGCTRRYHARAQCAAIINRGGQTATAKIKRGAAGDEFFELAQSSSFETLFRRKPTKFKFYPFRDEQAAAKAAGG